MHYFDDTFADLAGRVRHGDSEAGALLRRHLEQQLVPIVKRTLRDGDDTRVLDGRILSEARRIRSESTGAPLDRDGLVHAVAHRLSENMIANLHVKPTPVLPMADTVCSPASPATRLLC